MGKGRSGRRHAEEAADSEEGAVLARARSSRSRSISRNGLLRGRIIEADTAGIEEVPAASLVPQDAAAAVAGLQRDEAQHKVVEAVGVGSGEGKLTLDRGRGIVAEQCVDACVEAREATNERLSDRCRVNI